MIKLALITLAVIAWVIATITYGLKFGRSSSRHRKGQP